MYCITSDILNVDCFNAQWPIGLTKPIHEISNTQAKKNFLEVFGYFDQISSHKTLFKWDFAYFDKLWKPQNRCFMSKIMYKTMPWFYGKKMSEVTYHQVENWCQPVGKVLSPTPYWDWPLCNGKIKYNPFLLRAINTVYAFIWWIADVGDVGRCLVFRLINTSMYAYIWS